MRTRTKYSQNPMLNQKGVSRMVGILGGMGPAATVDFYGKLIHATPASRDQDHVRAIIWADPTVPDRHEALVNGGEDPTPWLTQGLNNLVACGAEILVVPCNTIHAYMPALVQGLDIEFIDIIEATVKTAQQASQRGRIGLLATDGALAAGLYQSALQNAGMEPVLLDSAAQEVLMEVIYSIKAGNDGHQERDLVVALLTQLEALEVTTVIAGCTDISVLLADLDIDIDVIDPAQVLAHETVERAWAVAQ